MEILKSLKPIFNKNKIYKCLFYFVVPFGVFYVVSLFGFKQGGFNSMEILRDTAQQTGESSFKGFLSNIGIWLWVCSAAICFHAVLTKKTTNQSKFRGLLVLTGILSFILAFDDFFMIHDRYVNQYICYLVYAICLLLLLIKYYKTIIDTEGFAFLLAGGLLALSILSDVLQLRIPVDYQHVQIFEEGFKFVGAATWLYFNSRIAALHFSQ